MPTPSSAAASTESGDIATEYVRSLNERDGRGRSSTRGLRVERAVVLHHAGLEGLGDHQRGLVEALPGLVHVLAEAAVLHLGQAAAHPEDEPALGEVVEHDDLLGHPQRVVPRQDDRPRAELDRARPPGQVRERLRGVGAHRVVVEVVLDRPDGVVAERLGHLPKRISEEHLLVGQVLVPVLEDEQDTDLHGHLQRVVAGHAPRAERTLQGATYHRARYHAAVQGNGPSSSVAPAPRGRTSFAASTSGATP